MRVIACLFLLTACLPSDESLSSEPHSLSYDCSLQSDIPATECNALLAIYDASGGATWEKSGGWGTQATTNWFGVTTINGHVVGLNLSSNMLDGYIPAEIKDLTKLQTLRLDENPLLTGMLPPEIGTLTSLRHVYLSDTAITGPIPSEIGDLSELRTLHLQRNELTGTIPESINGCTLLVELLLQENELEGEIPSLSKLQVLDRLLLHDNKLEGAIPPNLMTLPVTNVTTRDNQCLHDGGLPIVNEWIRNHDPTWNNGCPDADGDGQPSAFDPDDDNPFVCRDTDFDGCDDCAVVGRQGYAGNPNDDGDDGDADGICDLGDLAPENPNICRDVDEDGCDDCASGGAADPRKDGLDTDGDGMCDAGDDDIDNDTLRNDEDNCPQSANQAQEDSDNDGIGDACDQFTDEIRSPEGSAYGCNGFSAPTPFFLALFLSSLAYRRQTRCRGLSD